MRLHHLLSALLLIVSLHAAPLAWQDATYTTHDKAKLQVRGQTVTLTTPADPARPAGAEHLESPDFRASRSCR
jgi:hypothetical protein